MNIKGWFNKQPYWFKGGIMGLFVYGLVLIIHLLILLSSSGVSDYGMAIFDGLFMLLTGVLIVILFVDYLLTGGSDPIPGTFAASIWPTVISFVITGIVYFIMGCLIGWAYGRSCKK